MGARARPLVHDTGPWQLDRCDGVVCCKTTLTGKTAARRFQVRPASRVPFPSVHVRSHDHTDLPGFPLPSGPAGHAIQTRPSTVCRWTPHAQSALIPNSTQNRHAACRQICDGLAMHVLQLSKLLAADSDQRPVPYLDASHSTGRDSPVWHILMLHAIVEQKKKQRI
jgi:hypothetical protein